MPPRQTESPSLFWFRDDLRLRDNPGLVAAAEAGEPLILLYVLDDGNENLRPLGAAARWWLHESLKRLTSNLSALGQHIVFAAGRAQDVVPAVAAQAGVGQVFWNRRYGPAAAQDDSIAAQLNADGRSVTVSAANLLHEPEAIPGKDGHGFKVYSAFWRAARALGPVRAEMPQPNALPPPVSSVTGRSLDDLGLCPTRPDWAGGLRQTWQPGEAGAATRVETFLDSVIDHYAQRRDVPAEAATSMISPHLRFGEISPAQIWPAIDSAGGGEKFRAELGWREFAYHTLARAPAVADANLRAEFDAFPWRDPEPDVLRAWQQGQTGYPIVDAGIRQLWQTGWMHNRVRMVVASFLTKHLLIDWRCGERWFWDTLVDADAANNPFGWQWVAGSGFDAQPFFRIFNPILQGEKFDPDGRYVRAFVPEIAGLPDRFIHKPWEASPLEARAAGVDIGETYPYPMVDHATARQRALAAYQSMRNGP